MPRVRTMPLLAGTLLLAVVLGGCGSSADDAAAPQPAPRRGEQPTASARPEPSAEPTATTKPTSTPTSESSPPSGRRPSGRKTGLLGPLPRARATNAHLLNADEVPDLAPGGGWTVEETAPEASGGRAVGACQKTALGSIGALDATRRTFTAPGGLAATQVVGRFADPRSAWRAHEVLLSWREDCEQRVSGASVEPLEPATVHTGTGHSYRAAYGAKRDRRAAGLGILRTGAYLTVVEITAGVEDYPEGWDPARVALRRIARTF